MHLLLGDGFGCATAGALHKGVVPSPPHELENSLNLLVLGRVWRVWDRRRSYGALVCLLRKCSFRSPGESCQADPPKSRQHKEEFGSILCLLRNQR